MCVNGHWRVSMFFFRERKGWKSTFDILRKLHGFSSWGLMKKHEVSADLRGKLWELQTAGIPRQAGSKHASCEIPHTSKSCLLSTNTDGMEKKELSRLRVGFTGTRWLCRRHSCLTKWGKNCPCSAQSWVHLDRNELRATDNGLLLHSLDLHSSPAHVTPATAKSVWINFSSVASWDNASDVLIKLRQAAAITGLSCTN